MRCTLDTTVERVKVNRNYPAFLDEEDFVECNNTGGPRHVPGIRMAINFERLPDIQFSHGFGMWKQDRLGTPELAMIQLINDITDEADWQSGVDDFAVTSRWKALALAEYFSNHMLWDWCLCELRHKAQGYSEGQKIAFALDSASRVFKSDRLKDTAWIQLLAQKTYGCSISPWLYPFIYAATPIRADGISITLDNVADSIGGCIIPQKPFWDSDRWSGESQYYSQKSQWLATNLQFTGTGNSVRFTSPINNLHPSKLQHLYAMIETLTSDSIPEWNQILLYKSIQRNGPRIKPQPDCCDKCEEAPTNNCCCAVEFNNFAEWRAGNIGKGVQKLPLGQRWSPSLALNGEYDSTKLLYNNVSLRDAFKDKGLQVYIELSTVEVAADGSVPEDNTR